MGFWKKLFGDKKGKTEYTTEVDETQYYRYE